MSSGKVHIKWWKRVIPLSACISVALMFISPLFGIMIFVGYLLGSVIEPDLDQIGITSSEGRMMRQFGCFGVLWTMAWMPYSYVLPHRSFLSHFPIVSDLVRMTYILLIPAVLWVYFQLPVSNTVLLGLGGVLTGLSMATTVHFVLDM